MKPNPSVSSIPGNTLAPTGQQYDKKSGQWFGAVVRSSGNDGVVLVGVHLAIYINICSYELGALVEWIERSNLDSED